MNWRHCICALVSRWRNRRWSYAYYAKRLPLTGMLLNASPTLALIVD
jgi:hypothetical protein